MTIAIHGIVVSMRASNDGVRAAAISAPASASPYAATISVFNYRLFRAWATPFPFISFFSFVHLHLFSNDEIDYGALQGTLHTAHFFFLLDDNWRGSGF